MNLKNARRMPGVFREFKEKLTYRPRRNTETTAEMATTMPVPTATSPSR